MDKFFMMDARHTCLCTTCGASYKNPNLRGTDEPMRWIHFPYGTFRIFKKHVPLIFTRLKGIVNGEKRPSEINYLLASTSIEATIASDVVRRSTAFNRYDTPYEFTEEKTFISWVPKLGRPDFHHSLIKKKLASNEYDKDVTICIVSQHNVSPFESGDSEQKRDEPMVV